jgi:hypothetical protein
VKVAGDKYRVQVGSQFVTKPMPKALADQHVKRLKAKSAAPAKRPGRKNGGVTDVLKKLTKFSRQYKGYILTPIEKGVVIRTKDGHRVHTTSSRSIANAKKYVDGLFREMAAAKRKSNPLPVFIKITSIHESNGDQTIKETVAKLRRELKAGKRRKRSSKPIEVIKSLRSGKYIITDGFHRTAQAIIDGKPSIRAIVRPAKPKPSVTRHQLKRTRLRCSTSSRSSRRFGR